MDAITPAPLPPAPPNAGVDREVYCPACHYNLFGTVSGRCPECGLAFDVATLCESQIPWVHRKKIGWWKAYWRTVWRVLFSPRKFAREVCRPVNFADANRFRWVNIWLAWACGFVMTAIFTVGLWESSFGKAVGHVDIILLALAELAGLLLFLLAASSAPSDWCGGKQLAHIKRQRVATILLYSTTPLLLTPLGLGLIVFAISMTLDDPQQFTGFSDFIVGWILLLLLPGIGSWLVNSILFGRTAEVSAIRSFSFVYLLPLIWFLYALVLLVGLPLGILYLVLMVQSLV